MKRFLIVACLICLVIPIGIFAENPVVKANQDNSVTPSASKVWKIVLVGKLVHPMFENTFIGMQRAAAAIGGVEVTMVNPAEADPAQQVAIVEDQIARGVDAILVVPDDPGALEQVFAKANKAGILTFTHESVLSKNITYDFEAFDNAAFGRHHMDNLAKAMNYEGGYVCFVGNLTAVTHNQWVDAEIAWQKQKYPKMKLLRDRLVSSETTQVAYEKTLEAIKTYGDQLKGVIGSSASDPPGIGLAVAEKGLQDKVAVVGTSIGSMAGQGLEDGSIKVVSIWDPQKVGEGAVYVMKAVLDKKKVSNGMTVGGLGKITIKGKVVYGDVSGILDITKDNYKSFSF
jgi:simple sugar transport system substrate-binding protein